MSHWRLPNGDLFIAPPGVQPPTKADLEWLAEPESAVSGPDTPPGEPTLATRKQRPPRKRWWQR